MQIKELGGKMRHVGYPESLCISCQNKLNPCSFDGTRDVVLCPDFKRIVGQQVLPFRYELKEE